MIVCIGAMPDDPLLRLQTLFTCLRAAGTRHPGEPERMVHEHKSRTRLLAELEALSEEHRRVQEALHERDYLYRLLVEHSLGLMCIHDLDGVLLAINPAAAQSLGYHPQEGIGHNLQDFLAPAVQHLFPAYLARIRQQGIDSGLLRLVAKDGRTRVWAYRNVRYDEPGGPPCVLGHALDITERVTAEQALRDSEERFRLITEHARDLIVLMDPDGRCVYVSPSCQPILGYDPAALMGTPVLDLVHPADREGVPDWRSAALTEFRVRRADGRWLWLEGSSAAVTWKGTPRIVGIARDITERRRAERERALRLAREQVLAREREARAQVEAALRQRDDILALATHDLRVPLTNVLGRAEVVRLRIQQGGPLDAAWLDTQMAALRDAAMRMLGTIDEISDVARLQMGQLLALRLDDVDLSALVRVVAEEHNSALRAERITVESPAASLYVRGDRARLLRVLQNIVDNAVRYSPPEKPVQVTVEEQGSDAIVAVRDDGVGIPPDDLPRIFTRFYRASTATGTQGSGLGLAGAKSIVEQHGGELSIASAVGQGTTVIVRLPRLTDANVSG